MKPTSYLWMSSSFIWVFISLLIGISIIVSFFIRSNDSKKIPIEYKEPVFLQSPEYRYPTKCFDCIQQESMKHWNPEHGGRTSVGL